jgi:hypothetical protein
MKAPSILGIIAVVVFSTAAYAEHAQGQHEGNEPCHQIKIACENAGFVKGEAKQGYGLWVDCIDPIMQGKTSVQGATKPLPTVDPKLVEECRAKNPKFGSGQVGTKGGQK